MSHVAPEPFVEVKLGNIYGVLYLLCALVISRCIQVCKNGGDKSLKDIHSGCNLQHIFSINNLGMFYAERKLYGIVLHLGHEYRREILD